jgi:hypothetical protein
MKLKELKKGDFFTKKDIENPSFNQVFVKGDYDRSLRKYEIYRFSDVNACAFMAGDKEVFTDFTF